MFVFQKATISRFSIDWTCCSIDRKCDKYFGYNMHGSIGARSIEPNFRLIEIRSEGFFKKLFLSRILHFIQFFKNLFAFSLRLIHLKPIFVIFFLIFLKGFCLQVPVCPFYPFFFILFTYFMHFRCNFLAYRNLGFLIF